MILIPKLCFAIAVVSLFRLAQTNEQEVLEFLLRVGHMDEQVNQGAPGAADNLARYLTSEGTRNFMNRFRNTLDTICKRSLRDLLLKQLLEIFAPINEQSLTVYEGCVAASILRLNLPNIYEPSFHTAGYVYFSANTDDLLEILAELVRQGIEQINIVTAKNLAGLQMWHWEAVQNIPYPLGRQYCLETIERLRRVEEKAARLGPACDYIKEAVNLINHQIALL